MDGFDYLCGLKMPYLSHTLEYGEKIQFRFDSRIQLTLWQESPIQVLTTLEHFLTSGIVQKMVYPNLSASVAMGDCSAAERWMHSCWTDQP